MSAAIVVRDDRVTRIDRTKLKPNCADSLNGFEVEIAKLGDLF